VKLVQRLANILAFERRCIRSSFVAQVRRTLPVRLHLRALLARRIDALDASGYLRDATLAVPILLGLLVLSPAVARAAEGYQVYESTAASVNGEVLFVSDVAREACFLRCAAMPGTVGEILSPRGVRDRLILDTLALQEQRKLLLGTVDNTTLEGSAREAETRMAACSSPCKREIAPGGTREWIRRKLLLRDFFNRRVAVFVEVKDDDVGKELARRSSARGNGAIPTLEEVRKEMLDARIAQEIRNWQTRAASKSRMILSPMEDR
jgi:hypothetical protein